MVKSTNKLLSFQKKSFTILICISEAHLQNFYLKDNDMTIVLI